MVNLKNCLEKLSTGHEKYDDRPFNSRSLINEGKV